MKPVPFAIASALILSLASAASAATVLVDFNNINDSGAVKVPDSVGNYWNTLTGSNGSPSYSTGALVDTTNVIQSGVTITVSAFSNAAGTTTTTFSGTNLGWAAAGANNSDTGATVTNPLLAQAFAYTDGIYFANNYALGVRLDGLSANTTYSFSVYGGRNSGAAFSTITAVSGYTLSGDTTFENRTVADFFVTSDASGVVKFNFVNANSGSATNLNALSFTSVPEPSTCGLLGAGTLAGVALVRRRRRR